MPSRETNPPSDTTSEEAADGQTFDESAAEDVSAVITEVVHDLRNPLSIAQQYLNAARHTHSTDEDYLDEVDDALQRIDEIITARLELQALADTSVTREPVPIERYTQEAWRTTVTGDNELVLEFPDGCSPTIQAAPTHLQSLLENIFRNANDHAGPNVTVWVGTLSDSPGFYVADNGPGIPREHRKHLFEPGFTTSSTGTGLGLQIVSNISSLYNWDVNVTSSRTDGARFEFHLPETDWNAE